MNPRVYTPFPLRLPFLVGTHEYIVETRLCEECMQLASVQRVFTRMNMSAGWTYFGNIYMSSPLRVPMASKAVLGSLDRSARE